MQQETACVGCRSVARGWRPVEQTRCAPATPALPMASVTNNDYMGALGSKLVVLFSCSLS